ncbi:DUF1488 domain-containing protein [Ferrimonas gelatinilytica]|uniref:DUF1488 domain-containing protein n=1 Tax=Ferrimonas gelatinilytica TaxID=1255257 RepID=A0ABP9SC04_9GAMM
MNQQVQFNEQVHLHWDQGWLQFDALMAGHKVPCLITLEELARRWGQPLNEPELVSVAFEQLRFDLEAEAEGLIEDEAFDTQGRIWLGHPAI